jgi:AraC-like DNA-binding protein
MTVRGPETQATPAYNPAEAEFLGVLFKPGVFMPSFPARTVRDRQDLTLPKATDRSFWLNGSAWQFPTYENVDTFIDRLVCEGLLIRDPIVGEVSKGQPVEMSLRTVQRRFLQATGLTQNTLYQINRARYATSLLKEGMSILDTVHAAGYFDQPHLTRSLKHFIGLTPAQIIDKNRSEQLSFLYKTISFDPVTMPQSEDEYEKNNRIRIPDAGWRYGSARTMVLPVSK